MNDYLTLSVELASTEAEKAIVMMEAANEMESTGIYMEDGDKEGLFSKLIGKLKKLFSSIKEWFSEHFGRNRISKDARVEISKEEMDNHNKRKKIIQKLKSGVKNPKIWAALGATIIGTAAVGAGVHQHKVIKSQKSTVVLQGEQIAKYAKESQAMQDDLSKITQQLSETQAAYVGEVEYRKTQTEMLKNERSRSLGLKKKLGDTERELNETRSAYVGEVEYRKIQTEQIKGLSSKLRNANKVIAEIDDKNKQLTRQNANLLEVYNQASGDAQAANEMLAKMSRSAQATENALNSKIGSLESELSKLKSSSVKSDRESRDRISKLESQLHVAKRAEKELHHQIKVASAPGRGNNKKLQEQRAAAKAKEPKHTSKNLTSTSKKEVAKNADINKGAVDMAKGVLATSNAEFAFTKSLTANLHEGTRKVPGMNTPYSDELKDAAFKSGKKSDYNKYLNTVKENGLGEKVRKSSGGGTSSSGSSSSSGGGVSKKVSKSSKAAAKVSKQGISIEVDPHWEGGWQ